MHAERGLDRIQKYHQVWKQLDIRREMRKLFIICCVFLVAGIAVAAEGMGKVLVLDLGEGVEMEFVKILAGSFMMGSSRGGDDENPVHRVMISQPFWIARTEVTQRQYSQIMGANPSCFQGLENPAETVKWNDAKTFCGLLSNASGYQVALPTEAQWEYACRAGATGDFAGNLDVMAWYGYEKAGKKTHPVATKQANAWGLYDMHGNVNEWCSDWYDSDAYDRGTVTDPCGPSSGSRRVFRGGGMGSDAGDCRSAVRDCRLPAGATGFGLGFRACLSAR